MTSASTAAPKHSLDETLHDDAKGIAKLGHELLADKEQMDAEDINSAIDLLALTRDLVRRVDSDYKARIAKVPDPLAPFRSERKALTDQAKEVDEALAGPLLTLRLNGTISEDAMMSHSGTRLAYVRKQRAKVADAAQVPDAWLLPREQCIDLVRVEKQLLLEQAAAAAATEAGQTPAPSAVPGVALESSYSLRTKLADELED